MAARWAHGAAAHRHGPSAATRPVPSWIACEAGALALFANRHNLTAATIPGARLLGTRTHALLPAGAELQPGLLGADAAALALLRAHHIRPAAGSGCDRALPSSESNCSASTSGGDPAGRARLQTVRGKPEDPFPSI